MLSESFPERVPKPAMKKEDLQDILLRKGLPLIGEKDILSDLIEEKATSLFLGRFSMTEVQAVLGKKNFYREAKNRGLIPLAFDLDSSEYPVQRLRIFYEEKDPDKLIVDLKIREGRLSPKPYLHLPPEFFEYDYLVLEWLTLQNPRLSFSGKRPPLPGQQHPGLVAVAELQHPPHRCDGRRHAVRRGRHTRSPPRPCRRRSAAPAGRTSCGSGPRGP